MLLHQVKGQAEGKTLHRIIVESEAQIPYEEGIERLTPVARRAVTKGFDQPSLPPQTSPIEAGEPRATEVFRHLP